MSSDGLAIHVMSVVMSPSSMARERALRALSSCMREGAVGIVTAPLEPPGALDTGAESEPSLGIGLIAAAAELCGGPHSTIQALAAAGGRKRWRFDQRKGAAAGWPPVIRQWAPDFVSMAQVPLSLGRLERLPVGHGIRCCALWLDVAVRVWVAPGGSCLRSCVVRVVRRV